jgi:dTDP-4-dehydrorhamnose 3,5-epimerase
MPFSSTEFPGLFLFEPLAFEDDRGYFFESYNQQVFTQNRIKTVFVQDNQSYSLGGVIRGLHYQLEPHAQSKLVRVISGRILDVVLDIRKGSPSYGRSLSVELGAMNRKQLYIPRGFAHGFSVLSETAEVMYKCDAYYNRESEAGILYKDPALNIEWQVPAHRVLVSPKDSQLPVFADCRNNFEFAD